MPSQSPFLDVRSFEEQEQAEPLPPSPELASPFLGRYEPEPARGADPQAEAYVSFLNELYDDGANDTLVSLVNEAAELSGNGGDQRMLERHFAPLAAEAETMIRAVASELEGRDPASLGDGEVEALVDAHTPVAGADPQFEEWLGGLLKKVVKTGASLARSAAGAIAKWGLGPILNKLLALLKPLLRQVADRGIGLLPAGLQPIARTLRDKVPFLAELEEPGDIAQLQHEFNRRVADLLFASTEAELELEVAEALRPGTAQPDPVTELEAARRRFADDLRGLKEGEDPGPYVENFIPALLPVLKVGLKLAGRERVVTFLASFLGKMIQRFVGPQYAPALSKAMVDAGLRLLNLETPPESEDAVAATVEDTVRRVAALPAYVLDDRELLEGAALEAFEQAAAANLPPVLPDQTYRQRPELRERGGFWCRAGRRYKKRAGAPLVARVTPHRLAELTTFDGASLGEALEEQYGIAPGEEVDARMHLYEALPGMRLADIVRGEDAVVNVGDQGENVLHPLTRDAAATLLGEPALGRDVGPGGTGDPTSPPAGQRLFYLEIDQRPLTVPAVRGPSRVRRRTRCVFVVDLPQNRIVAYVRLSEVRSQEIAVKLRQNAHLGVVVERLRRIVARGLDTALSGHRGRLRIIGGTVVPGAPLAALDRLPAQVVRALRGRLIEWLVRGLAEQLPKQAQAVIQAADDTADGVTLTVTLADPPGLRALADGLKGGTVEPGVFADQTGTPTATLTVAPGHRHA